MINDSVMIMLTSSQTLIMMMSLAYAPFSTCPSVVAWMYALSIRFVPHLPSWSEGEGGGAGGRADLVRLIKVGGGEGW